MFISNQFQFNVGDLYELYLYDNNQKSYHLYRTGPLCYVDYKEKHETKHGYLRNVSVFYDIRFNEFVHLTEIDFRCFCRAKEI